MIGLARSFHLEYFEKAQCSSRVAVGPEVACFRFAMKSLPADCLAVL